MEAIVYYRRRREALLTRGGWKVDGMKKRRTGGREDEDGRADDDWQWKRGRVNAATGQGCQLEVRRRATPPSFSRLNSIELRPLKHAKSTRTAPKLSLQGCNCIDSSPSINKLNVRRANSSNSALEHRLLPYFQSLSDRLESALVTADPNGYRQGLHSSF